MYSLGSLQNIPDFPHLPDSLWNVQHTALCQKLKGIALIEYVKTFAKFLKCIALDFHLALSNVCSLSHNLFISKCILHFQNYKCIALVILKNFFEICKLGIFEMKQNFAKFQSV